ncbi:hypothetical protein DM860_012927 [Cuscuta australis]|uniref:GATA-type domain-containing protein n=1 Tax=Cuscuta australis TaxID=267555 RepID=A0A328DUW9_9ASTE|nr:hypothetical protein DM860_012927 [Cuscuta australis]
MGPPEKPVLCNACGSRWRLRRNLNDYVPKHALSRYYANGKHQSTLPYEAKKHPARKTDYCQKLKLKATDPSLNSPEGGKCVVSSSGSSVPSPEKSMLPQGEEVSLVRGVPQEPAWNAESVTRKKRSNIHKQPSSSTNTLCCQLHKIRCDSEDEKNAFNHEEQEEDTLIYQKWQFIADNEIGFGAIPLNPPNVP